MNDWLFPDEIDAHLASGDPARVATGLHALVDHLDAGDTWPMPFQAPPIPADAPPAVLLDLLRVWTSWDWVPPVPPEHVRALLVDQVGAHADPRFVYEVALELRITRDPAVIAGAVERVASGTSPIEGHAALIGHLLDGAPVVRAATVAALAAGRRNPRVQALVARIRPVLSPAELTAVTTG